ncbi:MAG TPA: M48 family metalloprotease [Gammaproteobacteria bacterium]
MIRIKFITVSILLALSACASDGGFDKSKVAAVGATLAVGALAASSLEEKDVKEMSAEAAKELDGKNKVADANNPYAVRLARITRGMQDHNGLKLNFKVYLAPEVNAFAMADGTVRVYSGLLEAMPDDQVFAVIGHEVGHVVLKHSYKQMREQLKTSAAFKAVAAAGGTIGKLTSSQLGAIAYKAVNARFSQEDELDADKYAVKMLDKMDKDPYAMKRAIETLEKKYGSGGGGFLSSHPSNSQRKSELEKAINNLN